MPIESIGFDHQDGLAPGSFQVDMSLVGRRKPSGGSVKSLRGGSSPFAFAPLLAALLDLLSVAFAYGVLVLVFRFGVGHALLGTYRVSQIEGWVPVFIFAMLFGLSMDYEVFIVARMREARLRGATTDESIVHGLANTGGVVTAAAVILVGALTGLVIGHVAGLQELGVGLAAGVLVDATIVRGLLLPGAMTLLGDRNWWLPEWAERSMHVKNPSPEGTGS